MRRLVALLVGGQLLAAGASTAQHDDHGHSDDATSRHRFQDAEQWALRFEDPARDAWQRPELVLEKLVDRDDLVIADIGSATGYFPARFARAVPRGFVIGADIEKGMVRYLNDRARKEGIPNLVSVLAAKDDPHLPRRADLVFLCNTYHHIDDRIGYLRRLKEQIAPGGRIAVIDWRVDSEMGPPHKLAREAVRREMDEAGYTLVADHPDLPEQYFLVYSPE